MLRLPQIKVVSPTTVQEACELLSLPDTMIVAGGTDLLPNLKHRLHDEKKVLVNLSHVKALKQHRETDSDVYVGAGITLTELSKNLLLKAYFPSLTKAASLVASPNIRNMGTIGGNIHLDTRCRYVNQTEFWRSAIGGCLKSEGDVCHVVPKGRNCVAAMSSDCVPPLMTLDAELTLQTKNGSRTVPIRDYYNTDGTSHIQKEPGELLTEIRIPKPTGRRKSTYVKWTVRKSIDFPLISTALRFDLEANDTIVEVAVCVGVLNAKPRLMKHLETFRGRKLTSDILDELAALIHKQSKPLGNVPYDASYRRKVLPIHVQRSFGQLVESAW